MSERMKSFRFIKAYNLEIEDGTQICEENPLKKLILLSHFFEYLLCMHWFYAVSAFCLLLTGCISVLNLTSAPWTFFLFLLFLFSAFCLLLTGCISVFLYICAVYEQFYLVSFSSPFSKWTFRPTTYSTDNEIYL